MQVQVTLSYCTYCRVSDVTKPLSIKLECVTDPKLFGNICLRSSGGLNAAVRAPMNTWEWVFKQNQAMNPSQPLHIATFFSLWLDFSQQESQTPITPCTYSSMSPSFIFASDKVFFLVPFVDPVYICWGVNVFRRRPPPTWVTSSPFWRLSSNKAKTPAGLSRPWPVLLYPVPSTRHTPFYELLLCQSNTHTTLYWSTLLFSYSDDAGAIYALTHMDNGVWWPCNGDMVK